MEMNGAPNKNTVGNIGDICLNTITNDKYKCVAIYKIESDEKITLEYDWMLMSGQNDAKTVNGYSIWVGTTEELNALSTRDSNTLYFEKDDE